MQWLIRREYWEHKGMLVWVPLRRGRVQGLVLSLQDGGVASWDAPPGTSTAGYTVRSIVDIADSEVRVPVAQIALARPALPSPPYRENRVSEPPRGMDRSAVATG